MRTREGDFSWVRAPSLDSRRHEADRSAALWGRHCDLDGTRTSLLDSGELGRQDMKSDVARGRLAASYRALVRGGLLIRFCVKLCVRVCLFLIQPSSFLPLPASLSRHVVPASLSRSEEKRIFDRIAASAQMECVCTHARARAHAHTHTHTHTAVSAQEKCV
jgi:hypothetical protein